MEVRDSPIVKQDCGLKSQGLSSITKLSYESWLHCELLSVLCKIELLADGVQGRRHLWKGTRGRILALMADPWKREIRIEKVWLANHLTIGMLQLDSASATSVWLTWIVTTSIIVFRWLMIQPRCPLDFHICFPQSLAAPLDPEHWR